MRKKILYIVLLTMMVLTACGKTEEKKEPTKTEQTDKQEDSTEFSEAKDEDSQSTPDAPNDDEVQEPSNVADSNTSSNNDTTTGTNNTGSNNSGSTTKPSTGSIGSTNNSGSTDNSGSAGNTGNTQNNNGGTTTQPSTPVHEHIWTEVTEDKIHYYDWINTCFKCGANLTKMTEDDRVYHVAIVCRSSYGVKLVEVDYVTENIQKEPVVTGYKCECGATKK